VDVHVVLLVFGVVALAELPDKSMFATLALGTRFRPWWVFVGVAAAFAVHVVIAVLAGGLLALLPHRLVAAIVAVLFSIGAALLLLGSEEDTEAAGEAEASEVTTDVKDDITFRRVALTSFAVIFVGEWGDITQILLANYSASFHDPWSVAVGGLLALWTVAAIAVTAASKILAVLPAVVVRRVTGVILAIFALISAYEAIHG
jgi:putative Ca2+/H+ antiporter (TMEM165/GDT1 family)